MDDLHFAELERAVITFNPLLATRLKPGLSVARIHQSLRRWKAGGNVDPVVSLYTWKNGTILDHEIAISINGFFPSMTDKYYFTELEKCLITINSYKAGVPVKPALSEAVGRYMPAFWNGSVRWIAFDLLSPDGAMVHIDTRAEQMYRRVAASFPDFVHEICRAIDQGTPMICFADDPIECPPTGRQLVAPTVFDETPSESSSGRAKRKPGAVAKGRNVPELLLEFEAALLERKPALRPLLQSGLDREDIRERLANAGVAGDVEPLLDIYSWKNGLMRDHDLTGGEAGAFPDAPFRFVDLDYAIEYFHLMIDTREEFPHIRASQFRRYFPVFTNFGGNWFAIDLKPSQNHRVVYIEPTSEEHFQKAYASLKGFLKDAIRSNREDEPLKIFEW